METIEHKKTIRAEICAWDTFSFIICENILGRIFKCAMQGYLFHLKYFINQWYISNFKYKAIIQSITVLSV